MPETPEPLSGARRIIVYGVTGSGKSFAAERIAARLGLPAFYVDELTWLPGWVQVEDARQREIFGEIAAGDAWVLDSAYGKWLDVVLTRADLVVGLDYPRWFSLQRLVRRTVARSVTRAPVCNGNRESVSSVFSRDSIIAWHFRSFVSKQTRMRTWAAQADAPRTILFRRPGELQAWIERLGPVPGRDT
jgi:adenylate kinase family enzyme